MRWARISIRRAAARPSSRAAFSLPAAALALLFASGCFTEIGNPGKEQTVSARFRIDYSAAPAAPKAATPKASADMVDPKAAPKASADAVDPNGASKGAAGTIDPKAAPKAASAVPAAGKAPAAPAPDSLRILQFYFNVVEVNYTTPDGSEGRIWKVPDSLGKPVDFTGTDTEAVLPPVAVPPADYSILKLESRVPAHAVLEPDTIDFSRFGGRGYIKGIAYYPGKPVRFLCQFTDDYKINLVYTRDILEQWRQGDAYSFDFVFYASRWLSAADLTAIAPVAGADGPFVLIDLEHNPDLFATLRTSFFKSFNSSKVWKENPAP